MNPNQIHIITLGEKIGEMTRLINDRVVFYSKLESMLQTLQIINWSNEDLILVLNEALEYAHNYEDILRDMIVALERYDLI